MYSRNLIRQALRQRFVITLPCGEGTFSGVMVDYDNRFWRFEDCKTIPVKHGEIADEMPGRFWVLHDRSPQPLLQEITPDAVQKFMAIGIEP